MVVVVVFVVDFEKSPFLADGKGPGTTFALCKMGPLKGRLA